MKFYKYEPAVTGDYGEKTVYTRPDRIDVVRMHYEFSLWPKDDLQWCGYDFIGTDRLKQALEAIKPPITGITFGDTEISGDDGEFERVYRKGRPDSALGLWHWFKITGSPGVDDFGQNYHSIDLVVSDRVLELLEKFVPENSVRQITEWK